MGPAIILMKIMQLDLSNTEYLSTSKIDSFKLIEILQLKSQCLIFVDNFLKNLCIFPLNEIDINSFR